MNSMAVFQFINYLVNGFKKANLTQKINNFIKKRLQHQILKLADSA